MVIDSELENTPHRIKSKTEIVYTDHYAILVSFKDIPLKGKKVTNGVREVIWNTKKEGGWDAYYHETDENSKLDVIANMKIADTNEGMESI